LQVRSQDQWTALLLLSAPEDDEPSWLKTGLMLT
jgi:hypothetical protein